MAAEQVIILRKDAKVSGLKRYFTGLACKHGHVAERQTSNGVCVVCGELIRANFFKRNPGEHVFWSMRYLRAHPEYKKEHDRRSYQKHKVSRYEKQKIYNLKNPDIIQAIKSAWKRRNPEQARADKQRRRTHMVLAGGSHSASDIRKIYSDQDGKCTYCSVTLVTGYHIDHIVPLSRGGSNWPSNIQLLCGPCNMRKGDKLPDEFRMSIDRSLDLPQPAAHDLADE